MYSRWVAIAFKFLTVGFLRGNAHFLTRGTNWINREVCWRQQTGLSIGRALNEQCDSSWSKLDGDKFLIYLQLVLMRIWGRGGMVWRENSGCEIMETGLGIAAKKQHLKYNIQKTTWLTSIAYLMQKVDNPSNKLHDVKQHSADQFGGAEKAKPCPQGRFLR